MSRRRLPPQFAELESYADKWDLLDTNARYRARLDSTVEEMTHFCNAMFARGTEIKAYLDSKFFAEYSEEDNRLGRMMFSLAMAAQSAEIYKSVAVPDTGSASLDCIREPDLPYQSKP